MTGAAIEPMLALSTAHLAEQTCNVWLHSSIIPAYQKADFGWFIPVLDDDEDLPPELVACFAFARSLQCDWVMFDRDAAIVPTIPTFDW